MKVISRLVVILASLAIVGCGAEDEGIGTHTVGMKAAEPTAEPPKGDERGAQPDPEEGSPDEVRETGFEPVPEAAGNPNELPCLDCVRETGFVPAPVLHLDEVVGGVARLQWTVDDSVDRARLDVTRYGSDGHIATTEAHIVEGTERFDLWLDGMDAAARVTALDDDGKVRSKESNVVEIDGR